MKKIKAFLYQMRRELLIFLFLFFSLLCTLPGELHGWNTAWYALDYSLGFGSRLFLGSFLKLLFPDFLPADAVYTFVLLTTILFLFLLAWILGFALRKAEKPSAETGLLLITVFYLICPGSPAYLWTEENIGRFDLFLLLFTLIAAVFYLKISSPMLRFFLFTVIGLIALSIHQVFLFIFFPLLFTMYVGTATEKNTKTASAFSFKEILSAFACLLVLAIAFLYFQFSSDLNVASIEELTGLLAARTDLAISDVALSYEYFMPMQASFQDLVLGNLSERIRYGLVTVFLLSPILLLYAYLWKTILKQAPKGKQRIPYLLLLLSHLCFLPAFVLTIDWGRWFGAFLTVQALQIILLAAKKDAVILSALSTLGAALRKHPYVFVMAGMWIASLHKFQATLLPDAPIFFSSVYKIYSLIF